MVLYTIVDPQALWEAAEEFADFDEVECEGARLLVWRTGVHKGRIARVISTDVAHYLDARFQPGELPPSR